MAYSTTDNIRQEAGFTGNSNISDARIDTFKNAASSQIDGILGRVYSLPLSSTPGLLELIERKLAAGHLLLEEYGKQAEGTSKDGKAKVEWAEDKLQLIEDGLIELRDSSGNLLTKATRVTLTGFPDDSTGTDKTDEVDKDNPPIFEIGQKF